MGRRSGGADRKGGGGKKADWIREAASPLKSRAFLRTKNRKHRNTAEDNQEVSERLTVTHLPEANRGQRGRTSDYWTQLTISTGGLTASILRKNWNE